MRRSSVGYHKEGSSLEAELLQALKDSNAQVRSQAARVLGWIESQAAYGDLRTLLSDSSEEVRLHALRAMRTIDPAQTRSLPELEALEKQPDERMQVILKSLQTP